MQNQREKERSNLDLMQNHKGKEGCKVMSIRDMLYTLVHSVVILLILFVRDMLSTLLLKGYMMVMYTVLAN